MNLWWISFLRAYRTNCDALARTWTLAFVNYVSGVRFVFVHWPLRRWSVWRLYCWVITSLRRISHVVERLPQSLPRRDACRFSCKVPVFWSDFNQNWNVSTNFNKTPQYQISSKSVQLFSSCYVRTDGHLAKLISAFSQLLVMTCLKTRFYEVALAQVFLQVLQFPPANHHSARHCLYHCPTKCVVSLTKKFNVNGDCVNPLKPSGNKIYHLI
jgi:hypothetical protein